jgi:hypothetical protein
MSRRLDDLDPVAFIDQWDVLRRANLRGGVGHRHRRAKHPLAIEEGSTENATLVTDLITGLRERGLDVTRPILAMLDGPTALARAAGMLEANHQFRRINGHLHLPRLRAALEVLHRKCQPRKLEPGQEVALWSPGPPAEVQ